MKVIKPLIYKWLVKEPETNDKPIVLFKRSRVGTEYWTNLSTFIGREKN